MPGAWDPANVEDDEEIMENIGAFEVPKSKRICECYLHSKILTTMCAVRTLRKALANVILQQCKSSLPSRIVYLQRELCLDTQP